MIPLLRVRSNPIIDRTSTSVFRIYDKLHYDPRSVFVRHHGNPFNYCQRQEHSIYNWEFHGDTLFMTEQVF